MKPVSNSKIKKNIKIVKVKKEKFTGNKPTKKISDPGSKTSRFFGYLS